VKAILHGFRIDSAVRLLSRHDTPIAFTHICVSGPTGRAILNAVDPAASGLFIFHHPTLGDWSSVPALFKQPDGSVLHQFAGRTPLDGGEPQTAEEFAQRDEVELYVLGWLERYACRTAGDDTLYVAMDLTQPTLLDAIKPSAVVWRSDEAPWSSVDAKYKRPDGSPRVDPATVQATPLVQWVEPVEIP